MEELLKNKTDDEVTALLIGVFMTSSLEKYLRKHHPKLLT